MLYASANTPGEIRMESDVRIVIVDDSQHLREFVVQALSGRDGVTVQEATDGEEGVEVVVADPPDLVLLDLEMPRLNGLQVLDALADNKVDVPVILITSHGSEAIAVEVFRKGVRNYLIKPFTVEELYTAVDRALAEVRLTREKEQLNRSLSETNEELTNRVQELDTLYKVGKSVTSQLSKDQLLERVLDAAFHVLEAEDAALMVLDPKTNQLRTELYRQRVPGEMSQISRRSAEELAADAARSGDATASGAMLYAPLKLGDTVVGALGVGNRVSSRPFSEHHRRLLLALADYAAIALENARLYENLQQANQAKSEFVSLVAHELGAPITSIRGYAEMLWTETVGPLEQDQKNFIGIIRSNVQRMLVLVSDLQDVNRMETGQIRLTIEKVHLSESVKAAIQTTHAHFNAQSQLLTVDLADDLPAVAADQERLTQILINLLSNASKYTPPEGHIHIYGWVVDNYVHCSVSDTGIGLSPEDQAKLFTKFFRSDDPRAREKPGTGLGLCIAKNLIELQGGSIQVESTLGKGTTFTFNVPVAK
jgi:K+-sensing histidine kinase KdpD/CheY-like chemotaxis protein